MKEIEGLVNEAKRISVDMPREYEVIDYGDKVEVIVVVGDSEPDVKYDAGRFIVEYDGKSKVFDVGDVDTSTIDAGVVNGILSIKARRVKGDRKVEESIEEGEEEKTEGGRSGTGDTGDRSKENKKES